MDQYNNTNYEETDLTNNSTINQLDPVYKLITSENWNILINVPDNVAKSLNDKSVIKSDSAMMTIQPRYRSAF